MSTNQGHVTCVSDIVVTDTNLMSLDRIFNNDYIYLLRSTNMINDKELNELYDGIRQFTIDNNVQVVSAHSRCK